MTELDHDEPDRATLDPRAPGPGTGRCAPLGRWWPTLLAIALAAADLGHRRGGRRPGAAAAAAAVRRRGGGPPARGELAHPRSSACSATWPCASRTPSTRRSWSSRWPPRSPWPGCAPPGRPGASCCCRRPGWSPSPDRGARAGCRPGRRPVRARGRLAGRTASGTWCTCGGDAVVSRVVRPVVRRRRYRDGGRAADRGVNRGRGAAMTTEPAPGLRRPGGTRAAGRAGYPAGQRRLGR